MVSDHALSGPISLWKVQIFICRPPCMQIPLDADSSLDADPPPHPVDRMTHSCENNLRKLRLRAVTRRHSNMMPTAHLPTVRAS